MIGMEDFQNFMLRYGTIVGKLSELLGVTFIDERDFEKPIGRAIKGIIQYQNEQKFEERDYEIIRLKLLVEDLQKIKHYDETMLVTFREKINRDETNYYGFRFEVAIAAFLISENVTFEKIESPDFRVLYDDKEVFIECTSRRTSDSSFRDVESKIRAAIEEKSGKDYCQANTALFVDVTNLYFHSISRGDLVDGQELKNYIGSLLEENDFGSVIIFVFILDKESNRFGLNYIRVDSNRIDPILKKFLDEYYPIEEHIIFDFVIPDRG
ncbi:MAG: hypothetical protein H0Z28_10810 [Archaeoglobus sp.]|nr:hypothetical protein [Archaeoglobus sp.]